MKKKAMNLSEKASDEILVEGLPLRTLLGVFPAERKSLRTVRVDLRIGFDVSRAARSDDLADTLDWAELSDRLKRVARKCSYRLLEALASRLVEEVFADERVSYVDATIWKPKAIPGTNLGVHLFRMRS